MKQLTTILVLVISLYGCTSTKKSFEYKSSYDDTYVKSLRDSLSLYKSSNELYRKELQKNSYATVEFEKGCDSTLLNFIFDELQKSVYITDSLRTKFDDVKEKYIKLYANQNEVEVKSDGSFKAKNVSKATFSQSYYENLLHNKDSAIQFWKAKAEENKQEVKKDEGLKESSSKTKWFNFWWLILIGAVGGIIISKKFL